MTRIYNIPVFRYDTLPSTGTTARELSAKSPSPFLVIADTQTAGRGRQGKSFFSPTGGIYLSLVIELECNSLDAVSVTSRSAVAVTRAIEKTLNIPCGIKWVNDIYIDGRKVAGILVEALGDITSGDKKRIIIGVGINTSSCVFPEELSSTAYAIPLSPMCKKKLTEAVVRELVNICSDMNDRSYMQEYRAHSTVIGREVSFTQNGVTRTGTATEIDDEGALTVICNSIPYTLSSGEITLRIQK